MDALPEGILLVFIIGAVLTPLVRVGIASEVFCDTRLVDPVGPKTVVVSVKVTNTTGRGVSIVNFKVCLVCANA